MKVLFWYIANFISTLAILFGFGLILWLVYTKNTSDSTSLIFASWWVTSAVIITILATIGYISNYIEDIKPNSVREKQAAKAEHEKKQKDLEREQSSGKQRATKPKSNSAANAVVIGAVGGYLFGKSRATKGSYRVEQRSRRGLGPFSGSSSVYNDRNEAIDRAYKIIKRNPKLGVKVVDQKTQSVILKLP